MEMGISLPMDHQERRKDNRIKRKDILSNLIFQSIIYPSII
jgi:hypothetical protein